MVTNERSAGFIIYRLASDGIEYLLLDYGRHWDFAKGHVEAGETDLQAAQRELEEETGIKQIRIVPGFAREIEYFFRHKSRGLIRKHVIFFLAETQTSEILLSDEHSGYMFETIESAVKRVTYKTALAVLREADAFLNRA